MRVNLKSLKYQPFVSVLLVTVNVIIFLLGTFFGGLIYAGELDVVRVLYYHEYGRIIGAMFLHSGMDHLFNNMLILFFLGSMIEKEVGHLKYGLLYFLSGIGGNLLSLYAKVVNNEFAPSIGASGAIFGLDGVLLAMVLFSGRRMENITMPRVLLMIACSLYSGFAGRNIDNAAHVGGLLTGFAAAALLCAAGWWKGRRKKSWRQS